MMFVQRKVSALRKGDIVVTDMTENNRRANSAEFESISITSTPNRVKITLDDYSKKIFLELHPEDYVNIAID